MMSLAISAHQGPGREREVRVAQPSRKPVMPLGESLPQVAFVAKSLSDENRLRILLCVSGAQKSVTGIVEELNLSQPLVSHHLRELRRSLLVKVERRGPFVFYEVANDNLLPILEALKDLALGLLADRNTF